MVRRAALLCALLALAPVPVRAQDEAGDEIPPEAFAEVVDVEVVNVEVRVSDRQGRPITGLTRDDFTLFEDGERVEITYFAEVGGDLPPEPPPEAPAAALPVAPEPEPAPPAPSPEPRHFVLFLDLGHLTPSGMNKTFEDLQGFVEETLRPGDRVMVVERRQSLRVALELTDDRERVREVLAEASEVAPQGLLRRSEVRSALREVQEAMAQGSRQGGQSCGYEQSFAAESAIRRHAEWVRGQVEGTIAALTTLSRALAGLPGDKAVIYVGEGLEQQAGAGLFYMLADLCPSRRQEISANLSAYDLSTSFHRMAAEANAHRVTIYPLDAGGIRADGSVEAGPTDLRMPLTAQRLGDQNLKDSLFQMADETGGRAIFNTNRFDQELVEISEDVSRYYSLGFVPDHGGDGEIHGLRVKLSAPHHDLRHRKAYRDKTREERTVEAMLGTLMFGIESNPLGIAVALGRPAPGADGLYTVPLQVRVPLDAVALVPVDGSAVGRLRLMLTSLGPEGEWSPVRQQDDPFRLTGEQSRSAEPRIYQLALDLPLGRNLVAIGVLDEQGGVTSYVRREVHLMTEPDEGSAQAGAREGSRR